MKKSASALAKRTVIVDAGRLKAAIDAGDVDHDWAVKAFCSARPLYHVSLAAPKSTLLCLSRPKSYYFRPFEADGHVDCRSWQSRCIARHTPARAPSNTSGWRAVLDTPERVRDGKETYGSIIEDRGRSRAIATPLVSAHDAPRRGVRGAGATVSPGRHGYGRHGARRSRCVPRSARADRIGSIGCHPPSSELSSSRMISRRFPREHSAVRGRR